MDRPPRLEQAALTEIDGRDERSDVALRDRADHLHGVPTGDGREAVQVVIDTSDPLDFSAGFPPTRFVKDTDSPAEQIR